ncbi:lysylphosphatidylglycerol synthase transmembrane domain-containing protein [Paraliomyxa miuraensis]|uniref:lysylphosphatidylglycerol synthase transmembrane domain-containing protein n=1 Tax=Paraliomyxa miuraensis TaxID=376150 RepID=UPI00225A1B8A|nr:lysylphosphatidylglycerol synthase transmembrane domain-containing protein [Paraliomyxa miuraensis]MCX4241737.1 flippase-like domain-containing protein [Paraliomyxa miuraensis]
MARLIAGLRVATSVGLLAVTLSWLDVDALGVALRGADGKWLGVALLLSIPQLGLVAWRWSFTARRLGLALPMNVAWREYYLSALLNSVLPGGVVGDVARVARQAHDGEQPVGPVARAVVVERTSGQVVQWLVLLVGAAAWGLGDLLVAAAITVLAAAAVVLALAVGPWRWLVRVRQELRAALLHEGALAVQLCTSLSSLLLLVGMFWACAVAVDSALSPGQALVLVPWILVATVLPITVGGFGVRELSAAALFPLAGLPAAEGAASAVLFGAVSLVSVLPGLWPLLRRTKQE